MNARDIRATYPLTPNEVVAEWLALSVVESSHAPNTRIQLQVSGDTGTLIDSGRGIRLEPDPGDTVSHAERALTSIYPVHAADENTKRVLTELVWGERGSLGPALANAWCPQMEFESRRGGEAWVQSYRDGVPEQAPHFRAQADDSGTTVRFMVGNNIDGDAVAELVAALRANLPALALELA